MLKHYSFAGLLMLTTLFAPQHANAQISENPYKYLGNITTGYQMDAGGGVWRSCRPRSASRHSLTGLTKQKPSTRPCP